MLWMFFQKFRCFDQYIIDWLTLMSLVRFIHGSLFKAFLPRCKQNLLYSWLWENGISISLSVHTNWKLPLTWCSDVLCVPQWFGGSRDQRKWIRPWGGNHVRIRSASLLQRRSVQPHRLLHRLLVRSFSESDRGMSNRAIIYIRTPKVSLSVRPTIAS